MTMIAAVVALYAQEEKEVVTGASYANDIYYSMENGSVAEVPRDNWDLGFTTSNFSISVLANHAAGVGVYTWPLGDTADWATLDTTGMAWKPMYNSLETWDDGAFSYNALGHPDYGWGIYNMGTHVITGDSLYVIKTVAGTYKKLAIVERVAMANTWEFKYANLDGTDEQNVLLNSGEYTGKNFVYYSVDNQEIVNREPDAADWDLLFTKWHDYTIPFDVSGVLINEDHVLAQEMSEAGLDQTTFVVREDTAYSSIITTIGSDWKEFNMGSMSYELADTTVFFIKTLINDDTDSAYYKIYFTGFTGMSEGKYTFMQERIHLVSTGDMGSIQMLELYPNPASDYVNVVFDHTGETRIQLIDMTGRTVHSTIHHAGGFTRLSMDVAGLRPGLFFMKVEAGGESQVLRFIKE